MAIEDESPFSEWVDGEAFFSLSNSDRHQALLGFLFILLSTVVARRKLGVLRLSPLEIKLERAARQPDILFLATEHLARLTPMRLLGPADVAVELISEESDRRDLGNKRREYEAASVPKYWLFDARPRQAEAIFLRLDAEGHYQPVPLDADGWFRSQALPGFSLDPAWLGLDPLPDPDLILDQIAPRAG